jgi:dolichol-phosphate mannosyltransferase
MNIAMLQATSDRQVPATTRTYWRGKSQRYAVVIPVLQEGERLQQLLARMQAITVTSMADILIADGADTPELSAAQCEIFSITGVLHIPQAGGLSAQLRAAYACALDEGYEGIVTIDGNNKDDPEAIARFIHALEEGAEYIQASRFIAGGVAEHTPWLRHLAIRGIHAPLSSLAAGFAWTDSTQGLRAFTTALLSDARVAPFRSIFRTYEWLAYITIRAPRLGYRCLELPSTRRYPAGTVPTKIKGVLGMWKLLMILLRACIGLYNPPSEKMPAQK